MSYTKGQFIAIAIIAGSALYLYYDKQSDLPQLLPQLIVVTIVAGSIMATLQRKSVEGYGGPIRNTRKIPMTDCYSFCDHNYGLCSHMYPGDNVGKCDAQWRACRAECYFPNVQRMY